MSPEKKAGTPPRAPAFKTSETGFTRPAGPRQGHRLPPFAKALAEARARGLVPRRFGCGHVAVALDWDQVGSAGLPRVVCPPDQGPEAFDWRFLAGLVVHVQHGPEDASRIPDLVDALLAAGVARVEAVDREALARGEPLEKCWPVFEQEGLSYGA